MFPNINSKIVISKNLCFIICVKSVTYQKCYSIKSVSIKIVMYKKCQFEKCKYKKFSWSGETPWDQSQ